MNYYRSFLGRCRRFARSYACWRPSKQVQLQPSRGGALSWACAAVGAQRLDDKTMAPVRAASESYEFAQCARVEVLAFGCAPWLVAQPTQQHVSTLEPLHFGIAQTSEALPPVLLSARDESAHFWRLACGATSRHRFARHPSGWQRAATPNFGLNVN